MVIDEISSSPNEETMLLFKPNLVALGIQVLRKVYLVYKYQGLSVVRVRRLIMTEEFIRAFYAEHEEKGWFYELIEAYKDKPCYAILLRGPNAIKIVRDTNGDTDSKKAAPDTIRGRFGSKTVFADNAVHGSANQKDGQREKGVVWPKWFLWPIYSV